MKTLSILIPAFNEGATIHFILDKVNEVQLIGGFSKQVVIVNDCSTDATEEAILSYQKNNSSLPITYVKHDVNTGKGAAIQSGLKVTTGEIILIQDADLEYDSKDYKNLISPILNKNADVVYGSRFLGGRELRIHFFWHYVANKILTFFCNIFTNLNMSDMETGYKVFKSDIIKSLKLNENSFGIEPEITVKLAKKKYIFYECKWILIIRFMS